MRSPVHSSRRRTNSALLRGCHSFPALRVLARDPWRIIGETTSQIRVICAQA